MGNLEPIRFENSPLFWNHTPSFAAASKDRSELEPPKSPDLKDKACRLETSRKLHNAFSNTRRLHPSERQMHEERRVDLKERRARQKDVYSRNTDMKFFLVKMMNDFNKKIVFFFKQFRRAMKSLTSAIQSQAKPEMLSGAIRGVLICSNLLVKMLKPMLGFMQYMSRLNKGIHEAGQLVRPNELRERTRLEQMFPSLKRSEVTSQIHEIGNGNAMEVGGFAFQVCEGNLSEGTKCIESAFKTISSELEKRKKKGQKFDWEREGVKLLKGQHEKLETALRQVRAANSFG